MTYNYRGGQENPDNFKLWFHTDYRQQKWLIIIVHKMTNTIPKQLHNFSFTQTTANSAIHIVSVTLREGAWQLPWWRRRDGHMRPFAAEIATKYLHLEQGRHGYLLCLPGGEEDLCLSDDPLLVLGLLFSLLGPGWGDLKLHHDIYIWSKIYMVTCLVC